MRKLRSYIDRGKPGLRYQRGGVLFMMHSSPPEVEVRRLKLEEIRRRNFLDPELQPTHRVFLRWSENAGNGDYNPEADIRETHYDPLPDDVQTKVTDIVSASPWDRFIRKLYMTNLTKGSLAQQLGICEKTLHSRRKEALWYFRGYFEGFGIYG